MARTSPRPRRDPQSPGLQAVAEGFHCVYHDDHAQLDAELPVYDALYAWCSARSRPADPRPDGPAPDAARIIRVQAYAPSPMAPAAF